MHKSIFLSIYDKKKCFSVAGKSRAVGNAEFGKRFMYDTSSYSCPTLRSFGDQNNHDCFV